MATLPVVTPYVPADSNFASASVLRRPVSVAAFARFNNSSTISKPTFRTAGLFMAVFFLLLFQARILRAQGGGSTATLTGRSIDQSGAVLSNVVLTLKKLSGGQPAQTLSNQNGYYTFSFLAPGQYSLTATSAGFGTVEIPSITLEVNQVANVDITLHPGTLKQEVTVSASAVELESQSSSLGAVINNTIEQQLPLTSRDPSQLVNLVAGVGADMRSSGVGAGYADSNGISYQGRLDFSINGGIRDQAVVMVDGVDVTIDAGSFSSVPIVPTPDNTQEFKVMTSTFPANFGRGSGILNIVTKSGTNQLHGAAYEFLQNNDLDANNFFSNAAGQPLPHSERNQFGFAVGGPVYIPHVYNGKNKTFWFMDWEKLDQTRFLPLTFQVPSAAQAAGNFANYYATNGTPITIYNPYATYTDPATGNILRQPFAGNQIPGSQITPFAGKILSYFPSPNVPGQLTSSGGFTGISDYRVAGSAPLTFDRYDIKVDHSISAENRLMGRYSYSLYHVVPVNYLDNAAYSWDPTTRNNVQTGRNLVLSDTWTASPTIVITNAINWSRFVDGSTQPSFNLNQLGGPFANGSIQNFVNSYDGGSAFPNITIGSYAPMGNQFGEVFSEPYSNYQYQFGLAKTIGKHTIAAGFQAMLLQASTNTLEGFGGQFNITNGFTCGPNPLNCASYTGDALAAFELGLVNSGSVSGGYDDIRTSKYLAWYFQDDLKLTRKLTLNLGLRYDFNTPQEDRHNHLYVFNPTLANPLGGMSGPSTGGQTINQYLAALGAGPVTGSEQFVNSPGSSGRGVVPTDYGGVAPRVGFAYSITDKLVFRGGWAKLFMLSPSDPGPEPAGNGSFGASTPINGTIDGINPYATLNNPFPNGFNLPTGSSLGLLSQVGLSGLEPGGDAWRTPFAYQTSFDFQYQLPGALLSVGYSGSQAHDLDCPFFKCTNQIPQSLIQKYGSQLTQTVNNPFYGVITNPSALLSQPKVQLGDLLTMWSAFPSLSLFLPSISSTMPNQDLFKSSFNALDVQLTKQMSHGLMVTAAYTWSKHLTNADSFEGGYLGPVAAYQNVTTFAGERSLAADDVPQKLVIGHVYELPFGKNKAVGGNWSPVVDKIFGQWQLSGITTFQSGFPLPISETGHVTGAFGGGDRPNLIGNPCMSGESISQQISGYLNVSAFQTPAAYSFGNAPRTLNCRGNAVKNFDWSLIKFVPFGEHLKAELRGEFFNLFNRTQLSAPNTTFNSSGFGTITSQANSPRVIQVGLKLNW